MELNIYHLYPDLLNLYGDNGNVLCLKHRLESRGICANVIKVGLGEKFDYSDADIIFIGGGQGFEQNILLDDLKKNKEETLVGAIQNNKTVLAVCTGFQMLGKYYETLDGEKIDFSSVSGEDEFLNLFREKIDAKLKK